MLRVVDRWRGCSWARERANHLVVTSEEVSDRQFLVPYAQLYLYVHNGLCIEGFHSLFSYLILYLSLKQLWNSHVLYFVYQILIECPLLDDYFSRNWRHRNGHDKEIAFVEVANKKWVNLNPLINVGGWGHSSAGCGLGTQLSWLGAGDTAQLVGGWGHSSAGKVLALQTKQPEFNPQNQQWEQKSRHGLVCLQSQCHRRHSSQHWTKTFPGIISF